MLSRLTPPLNQHGFPVDAEKTGAGNTAGQGVLQKKKDLKFQVFLFHCTFCFSLAVLSSFLLVQLQSVAFLLGHALFFMHPLFLSCARCLLLLSSFFALLCAALPCAALFPLFLSSSLPLFLSSSLPLFLSSSLPLLLSLLPVLPPPSQVIGFGPCLRALAERRGFEPLKPFRGLLAFQAGQFNHSCTFPKSKTLR